MVVGLAEGYRTCLIFSLQMIASSVFSANAIESAKMRSILHTYELASGQAINFQKSGIFFNSNALQEARDLVSSILEVSHPLDTGRYLGLPSLIGRRKKAVLVSFGIGCGERFKDGMVSYYLKRVEKFC